MRMPVTIDYTRRQIVTIEMADEETTAMISNIRRRYFTRRLYFHSPTMTHENVVACS